MYIWGRIFPRYSSYPGIPLVTKEMMLGDIWGIYTQCTMEELKHKELTPPGSICSKATKYKWDTLYNSIKKYGLAKLILVKKINESEIESPEYKYRVLEGHHRLRMLQKVYGLKYVISVKVVPSDSD